MQYRRTLLSRGGHKLNESIIEGAPPAVGETVVLRLAALAPRVMTAKVTKVEPVTGVGPVSHEVEIVEMA